jgi:predicted DNA binding CopG/RHH family protein
MNKKISYTDGEIGNFKIVKDFLPAPSELVLKEKNVRVTINLRESSVDFFKGIARSHKSRYQRVIRSLIDSYATAYSKQR